MNIVVKSSTPPIVEIDTNAGAAYVRFSRKSVARTEERDQVGAVVTIDFDADGEVVGVELIGVKEFGVIGLLRRVAVTAPNTNLDKTRYVQAGSRLPAYQPA